ncbi:hypothetical protein BDW74DRAFT_174755 [Aspergillus multicolor]|uniref:MCT family MFS transporter n=1 Tax=Aspergillus multicolor TaxID=41759 RepID=UPI003CCDE8E9
MSSSEEPMEHTTEYTPRAWAVIFGAFLATFCSVGFVNSYAVFQEYYLKHQLSNESESTVAWLGGVIMFFIYFVSAISGPLLDMFGPRMLLCIGSVGTVFSIMMSSLCHKFYQFLLAQAVSMGIWMALLVTPPVALVGQYIKVKRGAAIGIVIAGSSLGGIVWPIAINELLKKENIGFGWTMRIIGFIMIPLLCATCILCRPAPGQIQASSPESPPDEKPSEKRRLDFSLLKKPTMRLLSLAFFFVYFGMFGPIFFITSYAVNIGLSTNLAFYLVSILNGASLFGRILPGMLADTYGRFNCCIAFTFISGMIAMCWTKATSVAGTVVFSAAYGFTSGAILSLQQVCAAQIATPQTIGLAVGTIFAASSFSAMASVPISGELSAQYGYLSLSIYSGVSLIVGSLFLLMARLIQSTNIRAVV